MKGSRLLWGVVACAVAMVEVPGCHSNDNVTNVPTEQTVQTDLNKALTTTVVPAVQFFATIGASLGAFNAVAGFACPDTSTWCSTGTATCSTTATGYHFDFNQCAAVSGGQPLTVHGGVDEVPNPPNYGLTLTNLVINGSPAISGTGSINTSNCNYVINVQSTDASISGTIVKCSSDTYPTGNTLTINVDNFLVSIVFNGTNTAQATAMQGTSTVAYCSINLDSDPLTSTCSAP